MEALGGLIIAGSRMRYNLRFLEALRCSRRLLNALELGVLEGSGRHLESLGIPWRLSEVLGALGAS